MNQEQKSLNPLGVTSRRLPELTTRSLLLSVLIGLGVAGFLSVLIFLAIFLPFHLIASMMLLIICAVCAFFIFSLAAFFLLRPAAIYLYLRAVHRMQKEYNDLYTPLTALTNIRKATAFDSEIAGEENQVVRRDEHISILQLVELQDAHQLILGVPGAGKTMALRVYQYLASLHPFKLIFARGKVPVYVPMKNYSLFLKQRRSTFADGMDADPGEEEATSALLTYLEQTDLPGMRFLRDYIGVLFAQGRLLLLCDGLNEIDSHYLKPVSQELVGMMHSSTNRFVMTCREVDYRDQPDLNELVDEGRAGLAIIYPLQTEQIHEFVERYVMKQDKQWMHTAGQIIAVIDRSRLRYHCTNPMMLFTLMGIIDKIGVDRGKQIDTRGRLLRESVQQLISNELARWGQATPSEAEVMRFLCEVACAARWANDRNAIQLRVSSSTHDTGTASRARKNFDELGDELRNWLAEHSAQGPFVSTREMQSDPYDDIAQILQFAERVGLIEISPDGVLSFRHELIAEYFVAEYFSSSVPRLVPSLLIREDLLEDVGRWSEPVAIWAGLLENPLDLAECFGNLGLKNQAYVLQALTLGLVCVGVLWTPPQADIQHHVVLPGSIEESLSIAVRNKAAREELALIFMRCAEEGGQEVYRSLLPLITVDGVDELLSLLDQNVVPDLLFTQLQDAVDNIAYEAQVKRIVRVLGRFGGMVIERATELSLPAPERTIRLRAAAINTLGWTNDACAVEPLMERLYDSEKFIVLRATNALRRLGPHLTLARLLLELEKRTSAPFLEQVHSAALSILARCIRDEQDGRYQLSLLQYQHIIEHVVPLLTSNYQEEPVLQQMALEFLVQQGRDLASPGHEQRWEKVVDGLLGYLSSQNDVAVHNVIQALREIGAPVVPRIIDRLSNPAELVRVRAIAILSVIHDIRALEPLLRMLSDSQQTVWRGAAQALQNYAPESIPGLIEFVLTGQSDVVAERAANVLVAIGGPVVERVIEATATVVPGRTRFLVQILERLHDPRAVPALIELLDKPDLEHLLLIAIIRALCQFPDEHIVPPLLRILHLNMPLVYEVAVQALGQLGSVALPGLLSALDSPSDTPFVQRVRRAILLMNPFPGEQLIEALEQRKSEAQALRLLQVFQEQGREGAEVLVRHLLHRDEPVREYIYQALEHMQGGLVVPALLDALRQPATRRTAGNFLLKYPDAAMPALVGLLGEPERGSIVAELLPRFGLSVLQPLAVGLNDQRNVAREFAQRIIVTLVRQRQGAELEEAMQEIVHLFSFPLQPLTRQALLDVLTEALADVSIPALLTGLEDARLIQDVADAFMLLAQKPGLQNSVLDRLIDALFNDERRRGAEIALIRNGALVVSRIGDLIINDNSAVAESAKHIMSEIGAPALSFIWTAQSDRGNLVRREAAMKIFSSMPPEVIKDELVGLLVGNDRDDIAMSVSLLLERIYSESELPYEEQVMVPELIEYVQAHTNQAINLRILALLLLLGEQPTVDHLVQAWSEHPQQNRHLSYLFLLLGAGTQRLLAEMFDDSEISRSLKVELAGVLSMTIAPGEVIDYVRRISMYGLSNKRNEVLYPDDLAVALRALGGLLVSGYWDVRKLQDLRDSSAEDDPAREIFSVLLGWRYEVQIAKIKQDMADQQSKHSQQLLTMTEKMKEMQERISNLEFENEKIREANGENNKELHKVELEKEDLIKRVDDLRVKQVQLTREKNKALADLEQARESRAEILARYQSLQKQLEDVFGPRSQQQQRGSSRSRP